MRIDISYEAMDKIVIKSLNNDIKYFTKSLKKLKKTKKSTMIFSSNYKDEKIRLKKMITACELIKSQYV